jgi:hypothetical protein
MGDHNCHPRNLALFSNMVYFLRQYKRFDDAFANLRETPGSCCKCILDTLPLAFLDHVRAFFPFWGAPALQVVADG